MARKRYRCEVLTKPDVVRYFDENEELQTATIREDNRGSVVEHWEDLAKILESRGEVKIIGEVQDQGTTELDSPADDYTKEQLLEIAEENGIKVSNRESKRRLYELIEPYIPIPGKQQQE